MSKSQVYSWRVDDALKSALEQAARDENVSVAKLLDDIVSRWLTERERAMDDDAAQAQLRERALRCAGSVHGDDSERAEHASERVRDILKRKRAG